jgi:RNA polymerase sigma-70 factor (ECF subfamily)
VVARAGDVDDRVKRRALVDLLQAYLPALRSYLLFNRRLEPDAADDLLQGFLADKVLEQDLMPKARREKGKFRTFLLAALGNYLSNKTAAERRQKRRPNQMLHLGGGGDEDTEAAGLSDLRDPSAKDPAEAFEVAWARRVLEQAVDGMRQECASTARDALWTVFEHRVLNPTLHGDEPAPYDALVGRLGIGSATEAANLLVTAKRMLARHLRVVVAEYEAEPGAVEEEIDELRAILSRRRGS